MWPRIKTNLQLSPVTPPPLFFFFIFPNPFHIYLSSIPPSTITQYFNPTMESESFFNFLSSDLIQLILSNLPLRSIIRSSAVCKLWHSITTAPHFSSSSAATTPWFFLYGRNNIFLNKNQAFAFDPDSNHWIKLPNNLLPISISHESSFIGSGGFFFHTAANTFRFSPILKSSWRETIPLRFSRLNPLIGVINSRSDNSPQIIVVGGVRFIGGLVDIEDNINLAVEIYNPRLNSWDVCPPLPADFRSGISSQSLSSCLLKSKFYVYGIHSCFISSFDLNNRVWSEVQTLRPRGVIISFLVSCRNRLILAGVCNGNGNGTRGPPSFNLWTIDELTMEVSEIGSMPRELLDCLVESDEDDKFASFKCVGFGDFVFVFNEEHRRNYPACVCEIRADSGECRWRRVPDLPEPVNRFHKVIGFCSTISLNRIIDGGVA